MVIRGKCPACGQSGSRFVVDLPFNAPPISTYLAQFYRDYPQCDFQGLGESQFRLMECTICGCVYQDPIPDDAFLARFYGNGLYGDHKEGPAVVQPYQVEHDTRELMMVVRFLQPAIPRPSVLDFGTGNGQWAILAAAAGLDAHATDLSDHAFGLLETRGIKCHAVTALPTTHFDFINTEQVFEHLTQPCEDLQRLVLALRPGGVLKIGVPYDPNLRRKLRRPEWTASKNSPSSLNAVAPIEHLNHFEPASLAALGTRVGLRVLPVQGWNLIDPTSTPAHNLRLRFGTWTRKKLGDFYRPYHALTQTCFFRKATGERN